MPKQISIPVPEGLRDHGKVLTEIVLREPTYDEYFEFGEIVTFGKAPDGTIFPVENSDILRSYIGRCLVQPKDPLVLGQCDMKLARAIKGAVLGFFHEEPSKEETSPTSQTTSSSNASQDASLPT